MKISFITCISSVLAGTITIETHRDKSASDNLGRGNTLFRDIHLRSIRSTSHSVGEPLANAINEFYATLYVGSNHQKVVPMIDTGSSDLWIMESSNPYCANNTDCIGMEFNSSASTTFKNTTKPWKIEYMDTSGAFGFLCQDTVEIGDTSVPDTYFAVADIANSTEGVFGIGYEYNEAPNIVSGNDTYTYPNFPVHLKDTGIINTIAYSLYLNDLEAQEGALLFGGVDHAKYYGTLGIVPIINMAPWAVDNPYSIYVMLDSISISSENSSCPLVSNMNFPVLFDSGSSLAILPNRTLSPMAQAYGYTWSEQDGFFKGECDMFDFEGFELNFSGIKIQIPAESLLIPGEEEGSCMLAIAPDDYVGNFIFGDIFIRHLYLVYDLEHNQVGIAQAKYTDESDIEEIVSTIPSATSAPLYSNTPTISLGYYNNAPYLSNISIHDARACETGKYSTAFYWPSTTLDQGSFYYGGATATSTAN